MILEEDEATRIYKGKQLVHLKSRINRIFVLMLPVIVVAAWFLHKYDIDGTNAWIGALFLTAVIYLSLRFLIFTGNSCERWIIENGRINREGQLPYKMDNRTVVSAKPLLDLKGYYELHVGLLKIVLSENFFPSEEVVAVVKKEALRSYK